MCKLGSSLTRCHPECTREGSCQLCKQAGSFASTLRMTVLFVFSLVCNSASAAPTTQPYLLHLPGIGGHLRIDDNLIAGLRDGGTDGWLRIYDWTGPDRGLIA